ncbi:hypothetical protein AYO20_05438 [Fonsecaea nubica]|uniref:Uncharacterized protein n=2 Tax=Fonsecaea TaxID=40354 RepID=A0A0D2GXC8_9EURO|nr:uncharacterized protein Z517_02540 [Fonsecaea pedrosoi CBS 271.37]XP_022500196.1 hypothetical protein AYO20_05438 [Fonsecaea nubica]KIW83295.1 hypothetical protein Z517_02540 [Fonsecaea pedrosoi CBS 271.37]OAL35184.1 hypothetical protein AYO20_05438 [Fonsecaea nubica]
MTNVVSHGRGGAANIGPDDQTYVDGGIVREGPVGDQGDGPYSAGRGGVGNIEHDTKPVAGPPHDADVIPETATRVAKLESHHVGRGGAGNEEHVHEKKHESFIDKIKAFFGSSSVKK